MVAHRTLFCGNLALEERLGEESGEILLFGGDEECCLLFLELNHFAEVLAGQASVVELLF